MDWLKYLRGGLIKCYGERRTCTNLLFQQFLTKVKSRMNSLLICCSDDRSGWYITDPSSDLTTGLATSLKLNTRTRNGLVCMISGFHLNRKAVPIAVVSIPEQALLWSLTPWFIYVIEGLSSQSYARSELSLKTFSLKKEESIIGSNFKSYLCRLNLVIF